MLIKVPQVNIWNTVLTRPLSRQVKVKEAVHVAALETEGALTWALKEQKGVLVPISLPFSMGAIM